MAKLNNQMVNGKMPIADWLTTEQLKLSMWQELVQSTTSRITKQQIDTNRINQPSSIDQGWLTTLT